MCVAQSFIINYILIINQLFIIIKLYKLKCMYIVLRSFIYLNCDKIYNIMFNLKIKSKKYIIYCKR